MATRKEQIINVGIEIAAKGGMSEVTLSGVARRIRCSHGTISYHFGGVSGLKRDVKAAAKARKDKRVLKWLEAAGEV